MTTLEIKQMEDGKVRAIDYNDLSIEELQGVYKNLVESLKQMRKTEKQYKDKKDYIRKNRAKIINQQIEECQANIKANRQQRERLEYRMGVVEKALEDLGQLPEETKKEKDQEQHESVMEEETEKDQDQSGTEEPSEDQNKDEQ